MLLRCSLQCTDHLQDYVIRYCLFSFLGRVQSLIPVLGTVSPFAGSAKIGNADGIGTHASFNHPRGLAIDQQTGNLFVCDHDNHLIRRITPEGVSWADREKDREGEGGVGREERGEDEDLY